MNKKAIGSIFTVIALVLALLKSSVWVIIGLLVASVVLAKKKKHIKYLYLKKNLSKMKKLKN